MPRLRNRLAEHLEEIELILDDQDRSHLGCAIWGEGTNYQ
jgi:hypothetical protein